MSRLPHPSQERFEVLVAERRDEAEGIISLELAAVDGRTLPAFEAGSHIDLHVGAALVRQYSLCGDPRDLTRYRLGILLEPQSRGGSKAAHEQLVPGARTWISPPRNNFRLVETARNSILIAGGIGITPLLGMAWRLAEMNLNFHLFYCTRSLSRTAFRHLLQQYPCAGRHTLYLDDDTSNGRFDALRVLADPHVDTHAYVCGPGGFMTYVTAAAERVGWSAKNVHLEHFSPRAELGSSGFRVRAAKSGIEVIVPAGRTIAQVLIENGVDVPLSCESGVCGTCLTTVLEGIPEHRDLFQTDDEKSSNRQMTLCCSRAVTPLLVLDI